MAETIALLVLMVALLDLLIQVFSKGIELGEKLNDRKKK